MCYFVKSIVFIVVHMLTIFFSGVGDTKYFRQNVGRIPKTYITYIHPCVSHPQLGTKCGGSHTNYAVFVRITPETERISRLMTAGSRINDTNDHF